MDLSPRTTTFSDNDTKQWLGSKHGTDCPVSITLDIAGGSFDALMTPDTTRIGGWKTIPSGVPVKKGANGNTYVLATGGGTAAEFHLLEDVQVNDATTNAGASGFWHGVVIKAKVPGTFVAGDQVASNIKYR